MQGEAELLLSVLGLGLNRLLEDGLGELHRLDEDRVLLQAQRIPRLGVLQADERGDLPRAERLDDLLAVRVHLHDLGNALAFTPARVINVGAG